MQNGVYVAVKATRNMIDDIAGWMIDNNIVNPYPLSLIHTTIIYSRVYADVKLESNVFMRSNSSKTELFENKNGTYSLVVTYTNYKIKRLHEYYMDRYSLSYDWIKYRPHFTISKDTTYRPGDDLPEYNGLIEFYEQYTEDLIN